MRSIDPARDLLGASAAVEEQAGGEFVFPLAVLLCTGLAPVLLWLEDKDFNCLAATTLASLIFQVSLAAIVMRLAGFPDDSKLHSK